VRPLGESMEPERVLTVEEDIDALLLASHDSCSCTKCV
jgi:hypothetical protein